MLSDQPLLLPSPQPSGQSPDPHPDLDPDPDHQLPDPIPSSMLKSASRRSRSARSLSSSSRSTLTAELRSRSVRSGSNRGFSDRPVVLPSKRSNPSERLGSQRDLPDDEARLVYIADPDRTNTPPAEFPGNSIRTTKYTIITFLPRNLFEQFHRVAYVYFLVLAALNQVPQLGVFSPAASILPLAFVLGVTAVKDGYEDWRRHQSDDGENAREVSVLAGGEFRPKQWKDIRVGDVIKVFDHETLPADIVLLATSDPTGVAYVQTINLDGESNLKTRYAKQETLGATPEAVTGLIRCEQPNRNIYGFNANVEFDGGRRVSLGPSNIVLRGCELKNTSWLVGVAVYTGKDTKVMLNSSGPPSKRSRLETHMNREIILLAVLLAALCSIITILAGVWLGTHKGELDDMPFYRKRKFSDGKQSDYHWYGFAWQVVFTFMSSVIQFQVMIPIALYISMELVRLGQAFFMVQDLGMFDERTETMFQCRALNINEDLGQIKYVFSDKTGTLTENKMEFQCASVYGVDYSNQGEEGNGPPAVIMDNQTLKPKMDVKTDPELLKILKEGVGMEADRARDFILALVTCNTIVPIMVETPDPAVKLVEYQGESPDEQALVYAAAAYGFMLLERTSGHIIVNIFGEKQKFHVLGLHEFDSDRKRMSVIIGCPDKTVKLFVKGADSSMFRVTDKSLNLDIIHATEKHLHSYSSLGLRTLVVGMRELTRTEFEKWQSDYEKANTALIGRGGLLRSIAANVECNLHLLGVSAIEDKLQEGVPEAIESLRQAGIKVWVLTGDKQETAISIGFSCKLLTGDMTQIIVNSPSRESCRKSLEDAAVISKKLRANSSASHNDRVRLALIIDGNSLVYILETQLEDQLFDIATACDVVLCCRVAPLQKAGIVALIKNRTDALTLAIGDGANDVSMIQMADVGIGISGQEGRQAVMASDFAMGQFRFLVTLLLVHGHWNYQRMGYMILYNYYRNAAFVFVLFWYELYTAFTSSSAISMWSAVLYSVIYTAIPNVVIAILDKDVGRRTLLKHPQLYGAGQRDESYNSKLFILVMLDTVWQSLVIFYIPYLAYRHSTVDMSSIGDLWILAVVILVNLHLAIDVFEWNWTTHASIWGSIVATVLCVIVLDCIWTLPGYWAIFHAMGSGRFWVCLLGIIVVGLIPHVAVKAFKEYVMPTDVQIAREKEKFQSSDDATPSQIEMRTLQQT